MQEVFGDDYKLTNADKADLAALLLDVGGLAAGFVPGGSTVSAATGLGSTLISYRADLSRRGFTWGGLGNAVVSAGLDAASLIPGLGQVAKGKKLVSGLAKTSKWALKALKYAGYGQAAEVLMRATSNPSSITLQDWQVLAGGLKGLQSS